jgi:hypothetical protein
MNAGFPLIVFKLLKGDFLDFLVHYSPLLHLMPLIFAVSEEVGFEPRNVSTLALRVRRSNHSLNWCNVSLSPTDVSPTENSWMLHPLDKVSLGYFAPDRTIPSPNFDFLIFLIIILGGLYGCD